jgi:hypothetical protein
MYGSIGPVQPSYQGSARERPTGGKKKKKPPKKDKDALLPADPQYSLNDRSSDREHLDIRV